ncbi:MAG: hypothetical protein RLZZ71_146 [Bacteroidota bacterium]|jgi:RimJ/RimL family protein N-acetyltransferase
MNSYKALSKQFFSENEYSIIPIRFEDRLEIMQWRNEQMYHLRQTSLLTKESQDRYFREVVFHQFKKENPEQILFSLLRDNECIGYGGLVHINWVDKNAELSFIMNTKLEMLEFSQLWMIFLRLIESPAFEILDLHKIYTYAFDLRPALYPVLLDSGFKLEACLKEHTFFDGKFVDVLIHSKFKKDA